VACTPTEDDGSTTGVNDSFPAQRVGRRICEGLQYSTEVCVYAVLLWSLLVSQLDLAPLHNISRTTRRYSAGIYQLFRLVALHCFDVITVPHPVGPFHSALSAKIRSDFTCLGEPGERERARLKIVNFSRQRLFSVVSQSDTGSPRTRLSSKRV